MDIDGEQQSLLIPIRRWVQVQWQPGHFSRCQNELPTLHRFPTFGKTVHINGNHGDIIALILNPCGWVSSLGVDEPRPTVINFQRRRCTHPDRYFLNDQAACIVPRDSYSEHANFAGQCIFRWLNKNGEGRVGKRRCLRRVAWEGDVPASTGFGKIRLLVGVTGVNQMERQFLALGVDFQIGICQV